MRKAIGSIREGIGFIPNSNFACDTEITSLEFGEYAITLANSGNTLALLRELSAGCSHGESPQAARNLEALQLSEKASNLVHAVEYGVESDLIR